LKNSQVLTIQNWIIHFFEMENKSHVWNHQPAMDLSFQAALSINAREVDDLRVLR
jgi:hypothetical protein